MGYPTNVMLRSAPATLYQKCQVVLCLSDKYVGGYLGATVGGMSELLQIGKPWGVPVSSVFMRSTSLGGEFSGRS